jgi:hypothetical protein
VRPAARRVLAQEVQRQPMPEPVRLRVLRQLLARRRVVWQATQILTTEQLLFRLALLLLVEAEPLEQN